MRRLLLLTLALAAFPAGLGLAVYAASGSSFGSPATSARVPTGTIAQPSKPPAGTTTDDTRTETERCDEEDRSGDCPRDATTDETTTEQTTTSDSGRERDTTTERTTTSDSGSGSDSGRSGSGDDD